METSNRFSNKISDYELLSLIGVGSFGRVYSARIARVDATANHSHCRYCAVKCIEKKSSPNIGKIFTEVSIHLRVRSEHILQLYNVIEDEEYVYLVLELCNGGTLAQLIKRVAESCKQRNALNGVNGVTAKTSDADIVDPIIPHEVIRNIIRQLCSGLDYLHRNAIVHRDLNLNNLLLVSPIGDDYEDIVIKIADFGLAIDLNSSNVQNVSSKPHREEHVIPLPIGTTICGTPGFISPEVWSQMQTVSPKSDIFSVGSVLFSLISGYTPKGKLDLSRFSPLASDLICRLLAPEPENRPSIDDIRNHPYLIGPFNTDRLLPINKLTKTLNLCITEDGKVILNFLKKQSTIEISNNGEMISIKSLNSIKNYTFDSIPSNHWKKYMYALRFVELVKAKTPKISIYCKNDGNSNKNIVKCCLMENNDFEVTLFDSVSNENTKIIVNDREATLDKTFNDNLIRLRDQCFEAEKQLECMKKSTGIEFFPATFGRKTKTKTQDSDQISLTKQSSLISSQVLRSVHINGIGVASQLLNGIIQVTFIDGSSISLASNSQITFWLQNDAERRYSKHDALPDCVKDKLALLPEAINQLRINSTSRS